jgi:DnaJ-class molecular chaperone
MNKHSKAETATELISNEIKCPTCEGSGKRPCPALNCRNGWDTVEKENCSKCNGEGEIDCINCKGTGEQ